MHRVEEVDGILNIWIEAPGFKREQFKVESVSEVVRGTALDLIKIHAHNPEKALGSKTFTQTAVLTVKPEEIEARYEAGVLHLAIIPKAPDKRVIEVK